MALRSLAQLKPALSSGISLPNPGERIPWLLGRGNTTSDRDAFFVWQDRQLDVLLSWGIGNTIAGAALTIGSSGLTRAIGVQALVWGAIDTAVATFGQCSARNHAVTARSGLFGARHIHDRARHFSMLLAIQVVADVAYVLAGSFIAAKWDHPWLRGTGIGLTIQGSALLLYDATMSIRMLLRPELRYAAN